MWTPRQRPEEMMFGVLRRASSNQLARGGPDFGPVAGKSPDVYFLGGSQPSGS